MDSNKETNPVKSQNEQSENVKVTLTLNGNTKHIQWNKHTPLLDVCKLEEGEVRLKRNFVLSEAHIQQGLILACVAVPISASIKINYDEF